MLLALIIGIIIALQFGDAIASYPVLKDNIEKGGKILQWFAGKIGLAPTIITAKVVIVAAVLALYWFTQLPWWVYLLAVAYYLYRSGKYMILWRELKKVQTKVEAKL